MTEEELYPAEHPFICTIKDSHDQDETPYTATTDGFPLYKGSYHTAKGVVPVGFQWNDGDHFVSFPIKEPNANTKQAEFIQVIMHPNPIIVGLCEDSDKVYSKPLYAQPIYRYDGKPVYTAQELEVLKMDAEGAKQTNHMIHCLHDPSLMAEVHRFHMVSQELDRVEEALVEVEDQWGELAAMKLKTIRRLEAADTIKRIQEQDKGLVDNVLRQVMEKSQWGHCTWKGGDVTFAAERHLLIGCDYMGKQ